DFYHKLQKTTRVIKQVLLDQSIISGIGNIYASEILFLACIHHVVYQQCIGYVHGQRRDNLLI
ncbi:MAG: hypothetical protein Q8830_03810, partial [Candidatus Phytoplasma australasiaticum]|nr:hypothetical protein [Candidatus Phytoplasma australasiaticum]